MSFGAGGKKLAECGPFINTREFGVEKVIDWLDPASTPLAERRLLHSVVVQFNESGDVKPIEFNRLVPPNLPEAPNE